VWEEQVGPNGELGQVGAVGGVNGARAKVYMVQMKSVSRVALYLLSRYGIFTDCDQQERDTAYTFGLVGKLRY
jgi:hypothetical protein